MAILAMPLHGRDRPWHGSCAMAILAMPEHGRDARGTSPASWPSWLCSLSSADARGKGFSLHAAGKSQHCGKNEERREWFLDRSNIGDGLRMDRMQSE